MAKQQGRKAVILFSDGEDNGSKVTLTRAIESAQRADTLVYSVRFYDRNAAAPINPGFGRSRRGGGFPGRRRRRRRLPRRVSQLQPPRRQEGPATDLRRNRRPGTFRGLRRDDARRKIYARIEDELRNQYSLGYTSDQTGAGYRKIKVVAKEKA